MILCFAGDPSSPSSDFGIIIEVTDVNDEVPLISRQKGCSTITEFHAYGEPIITVTAIDKDDPTTANGQVKFTIEDGNRDKLFDIVQIDSFTARIVPKTSLKGKIGNFTLFVRATDGGDPPRSSREKFVICVTDIVNDYIPVFVKPPLNKTILIPEDAKLGSTVLEVLAMHHKDYNSEIRYRFKLLGNGHYRTFAINDKTGVITLAKSLDREAQSSYEIQVEAFDSSKNSRKTLMSLFLFQTHYLLFSDIIDTIIFPINT